MRSDFSEAHGDEFGNNACAATSLLNEISEQYTEETGTALTQAQVSQAMSAAVDSGNISSTNAFVNDWEGAANDMAGSVGLAGNYSYTNNSTEADVTIYALEDRKSVV